MDAVFIYWDNSNIFHEAQRLAEDRMEPSRAGFELAHGRDSSPIDLSRRAMA